MASGPWRGTENLAADFEMPLKFLRQASPPHARLLELLAEGFERHATALDGAWRRREFSAHYERPMLLLAALRWEALGEGESHPLWAGIAADPPDPAALDAAALDAALAPERVSLWKALAERFVQTNETSRAVAWLWPASLLPPGTKLELFDLGASAGLNLLADALPLPWQREDGGPLLSAPPEVEVVGRHAFDAHPLDATDPDAARWLRACVWPGQRDRLARLDLALAQARHTPYTLRTARAERMPEEVKPAHPGSFVIAYQSIMRDYLDETTREAMRQGMYARMQQHPPGRVLWVELEQEGHDEPPEWSSVLRVHAAEAGGDVHSWILARTHPHPKVLRVDAVAVDRLSKLLRNC